MNKIKYVRAAKGFTQLQFSKLVGIKFNTYVKKERGETEFSVSEALKIASILNVSVEELFDNNIKASINI